MRWLIAASELRGGQQAYIVPRPPLSRSALQGGPRDGSGLHPRQGTGLAFLKACSDFFFVLSPPSFLFLLVGHDRGRQGGHHRLRQHQRPQVHLPPPSPSSAFGPCLTSRPLHFPFSLDGYRDSELGVWIKDDDLVSGRMGGHPFDLGRFCHSMRMSLWKEHLGISNDDHKLLELISDPVSPQTLAYW